MGTIDRRTFLGGAAGIGAVAGVLAGARAEPAADAHARNLIFLIADGMGIGTLKLADLYARRFEGRGLAMLDLLNRQGTAVSLIDAEAHASHVPDSAASASAWAVGQRCANGVVSVTPDGRTPRPLLLRAGDSGRLVGAATNTELWDVSVSAFFANAPRRTMSVDIAAQVLRANPHVLLGGGRRAFEGAPGFDAFSAAMVRTARQLDRASGGTGPLHGFFAGGTMPYELDREQDTPSASDMARAALARLSADSTGGTGFALVLEQAKVDHAAHHNDPGSLVREMMVFDEMVRMCVEFADRDGQTLLIITTDHANANPGLTVYGPRSIRGVERLGGYTRSHRWIHDELTNLGAGARTIERAASIVTEATGATLSPADMESLESAMQDAWCQPFEDCRSLYSALGGIMANHVGIGWVSPNHTSDHVLAIARGPGSGAMRPLMPIAALHDVAQRALGLPAPG